MELGAGAGAAVVFGAPAWLGFELPVLGDCALPAPWPGLVPSPRPERLSGFGAEATGGGTGAFGAEAVTGAGLLALSSPLSPTFPSDFGPEAAGGGAGALGAVDVMG